MELKSREVRRSLIERKINHPQGDLIDLSAMHIDDADCEFIHNLLVINTGITSVNLRANRISDTGLEMLMEISSLKTLDLSFNPLTNTSAKRLLKRNYSLTEVNVTVTDINFNGLVKIEKMLARNRGLELRGGRRPWSARLLKLLGFKAGDSTE